MVHTLCSSEKVLLNSQATAQGEVVVDKLHNPPAPQRPLCSHPLLSRPNSLHNPWQPLEDLLQL